MNFKFAPVVYRTIALLEQQYGPKTPYRYAYCVENNRFYQWIRDDATAANSVTILEPGGGTQGRWHALGGVSRAVATYSTAATLDAEDDVVLVDTSGGSVTITLPAVGDYLQRAYTIKKVDATGVLTLDATSTTQIDGSSSVDISSNYARTTVISDGSEWRVID